MTWRELIHSLTMLFEHDTRNKHVKDFVSQRVLLNPVATTILNPMTQFVSVADMQSGTVNCLHVGKWLCRPAIIHVCCCFSLH